MSDSALRLQEAQLLQRAGKLQEARAIYEEVLRNEPGNAQALYLTATLAQQVGNPVMAEKMLRRALTAQPDMIGAHFALMHLLEGQRRYDETAAQYRIAIAALPDNPQLRHSYGKMLFDAGRQGEAADIFRGLVAQWPALSGSWHMLGSALYTLGDFDGARQAFEKTLTLAPEAGMTHWNLSNITTYREIMPHLMQMEAAMARGQMQPEQKADLHFALGKAYHDLRQYDKAFAHYQAGAKLQRASYHYDTASDAREFAEVRKKFAALLPQIDLSQGCPDDTPIFILGMPRSGTTLIEQILSSHPDVAGVGETPLLFDTLKAAGRTTGDKTVFRFSELTPKQRQELGAHYVQELRKIVPAGIKHIADKMPGNFRIIGFIALILPNVRIIHCTRDAMDTCLSIFRSHFTQTHPYACDLSELGEYYGHYLELMEFWKTALPGRIYEANYEALLDDFEPQVRALLNHCGLGWSDNCLQFHKTKRSVATASGAQVRTPLYRSSLQGWRHYEPWLSPLQEALGS